MVRMLRGWMSDPRRRTGVIGLLSLAALAGGAAVAGLRMAHRETFDRVYVAAFLARRDPDAAVRKARHLTDVLQQDLGMPRSVAVAQVSDFLVRGSGGLCVGR
jgi:hypothetical protein